MKKLTKLQVLEDLRHYLYKAFVASLHFDVPQYKTPLQVFKNTDLWSERTKVLHKEMERTFYGLKHKEHGILGFSTESVDDPEYSVSIIHELEKSYTNIWMVVSKRTAEKARVTNTKWYNADHSTPKNPYRPEDLEVVEITLTAKVVS